MEVEDSGYTEDSSSTPSSGNNTNNMGKVSSEAAASSFLASPDKAGGRTAVRACLEAPAEVESRPFEAV
jgi:hypothetical protein